MFKIATWNVNSLRVRLGHVVDWINLHQPDVLALQELKLEDKHFPLEAFSELGYHAAYVGQKTYNGVATLSKFPIEDIVTDLPHLDDPQRRILASTIQGIRIINLYVPNGSSTDSPKYIYKLDWLQKVAIYLEEQLAEHERVVVLGDFNIAPEDRDIHDPVTWAGHVLCSAPEREALSNWVKLGFQDSFRLFEQEPNSFSWWDYRAAAFRRNMGWRIDHILVSAALAEQCRSCAIDKEPRKLERPSDHVPVFAEFEL